MTKALDVYLHRSLVGCLIQDQGGQMSFTYNEQWLDNSQAFPLSCSLPIREEPFHQKECRGFFAGLLPEESSRDIIARILGISSRNDHAMLTYIGGECAGAVMFLPKGATLPEPPYDYQPLGEKELVNLLKKLPQQPLLTGTPDLRLSLAGAQHKIAVHIDERGQISLPLGGAPSTHILKPAMANYPSSARNEALCLNLARAVGIPTVEAEVYFTEEIEFLMVQRYDRRRGQRLHQEDFCQALGIPPEYKYQNEGGPSLTNCFHLLRQFCALPATDIQHLLNTVVMNLIVGNHDAHGKNFSLLFLQGKMQLAPAYDILSTVYYPELTPRMAMKIGKEYLSRQLRVKDIELFAVDANLGASAVRHRIGEIATKVCETLPSLEGPNDLIALIQQRALWLLQLVEN